MPQEIADIIVAAHTKWDKIIGNANIAAPSAAVPVPGDVMVSIEGNDDEASTT